MINSNDNKKLEDMIKDHEVTAEDHEVTAEDHEVTAEDHEVTAEDHEVTAEDHEVTAEDHEVTAEDQSYEILKTEFNKMKFELNKTKKEYDITFNKLKYLMADFDNYRKQIEKQMNSTIESNKATILSKFLNLLDDYQRALDIIKNNKDIDEVISEGLNGIMKNFQNILLSEGVEKIETIGEVFDPNKHDVVSFSYDSDLNENVITGEIRTGYKMNDKVLRPSLVIISKKKNIPNNK